MARRGIALILVALVAGAVLLGSALGWFGGVVVCGADHAPGCVTWPDPISELIWAGFALGVMALLIWQLRT